MTQKIIHIGCPKAGSTFLQQYFSEHPDINYDAMDFEEFKRTGHLNENIADKKVSVPFRVLSEEALSVAGIKVERLGVTYQELPDVQQHQLNTARRLHQLFPTAKILMVVRGFETLIPSLYSQYVIKGYRSDFATFLKEHENAFTEQFNYDFLYQTYVDVFGESNVLVLPYEMLKESPNKFLSVIEASFGFSHYGFTSKSVNKSLSDRSIPVVLATSRLIYWSTKLLPKSKRIKAQMKYQSFIYKIKDQWLSGPKSNENIKDTASFKETLTTFNGTSDHIIKGKYMERYAQCYVYK